MLNELKRLTLAFKKKTKETSFSFAVKVALTYLLDKDSLYKFGKISNWEFKNHVFIEPLISIFVISYNSGDDLLNLFSSINNQTYKNLEIILVENGSENSSKYLEVLKFPSHYISSTNIGFAGANNLAFDYSNGSFVCLVNPDTYLNENVIEELLKPVLWNEKVAVSVPKILFSGKFIDFQVISDKSFTLDLNLFNESLVYKKFFIREGKRIGSENQEKILSQGNSLSLSIPIDKSEAFLKIKKQSNDQVFVCKINGTTFKNKKIITEEFFDDELHLKLKLDPEIITFGNSIINNAGSSIKNGSPYDIGFGEYNLGQYDNPRYVDGLCGCVAMISPKVFASRKIFIDQFFAYYEDSELSNWINKKNYKIQYVPSAIVNHKHSASTDEGSLLWNTFVFRSKNIYDCLSNSKNSVINKEILKNDYPNIPKELGEILSSYDQSLFNKNQSILCKKKRRSAGIFNSFWNTMGGGEKHALSIAKLISETYDIYLISDSDFDENRLIDYFSINFKFKKIISHNIDSKFTLIFDLFVNSTYRSNLISMCPNSIYLVSFPHEFTNKKFLKSYLFLHNSTYTKKWALNYWGKHKNNVLYPIIDIDTSFQKLKAKNNTLKNSNQNIISIGRFTPKGHEKRQDFILKAFKEAQTKIDSNFNFYITS